MPNDYLKKQPTQNERLIHELFNRTGDIARSLWSTSSFVTALAYLSKTDPEEVAKLLTTDSGKLKEYSDKINKAISEIEKARKDSGEPAEEHSHGHDHSHE